MSWQQQLEFSVLGLNLPESKRHVDKAIIISLAGDSIWATSSPTVELVREKARDELQAITNAFTDNSAIFEAGLTVEGIRYVVTKADANAIYARKGMSGVIICKTNKAFLIGTYDEPHLAGNAAAAIEKYADHMRSTTF